MSPRTLSPQSVLNGMNPRTLSALSLLNDLRHAATELLSERKRKYPALLLLYSFIDICASLAQESPAKSNRARFESYVLRYALLNWTTFKPYDLWAARSSLLHAYSPLGEQTDKSNGATPIFYFAWPETEAVVRESLVSRGYSDFIVLDVQTIKHIAISGFNSMWSRIESDAAFEAIFRANAEHLLKDLFQHRLEQDLTVLDELVQFSHKQTDQQPE